MKRLHLDSCRLERRQARLGCTITQSRQFPTAKGPSSRWPGDDRRELPGGQPAGKGPRA